MRGSARLIRRSRKAYIRSPRSVTTNPTGIFSRILKNVLHLNVQNTLHIFYNIYQRISLGGSILRGSCFKFTNKKELGPQRRAGKFPTPPNARNPFLCIFSKLFMLQRCVQLRWSSELHDFCRANLKILAPRPSQILIGDTSQI